VRVAHAWLRLDAGPPQFCDVTPLEDLNLLEQVVDGCRRSISTVRDLPT